MPDTLYEFSSQPGVRRDGTNLDSPFHSDGVWVRWQRGRPRKIGGYKAMTERANGPVRGVMLDSRGGVTSTHLFSQWGIQRVQFDSAGFSSLIEDRTPAGFTPDPLLNWSYSSMYSSTGGAYSAIIASSSPDVNDIASDTTGGVYAGNIASNDILVSVADGSGGITTSGGVCVLQPFLVVYGSNGLIRNSNANDYSTATGWTVGGANFASSANVAATKIVYGAPIRGGSQAPAGLFWALDSVIRMSFVGGSAIWQYDTLTNPATILSKNCVVEHEGKFFWIGTDRFLAYTGVVQEVPNQMNINYFFENLNYTYRNKVWGTRLARWGEIWWFYPAGTDTECGNAIVYNYRENTWYDAIKRRSAGAPPGVFNFPIWAGDEDSFETKRLVTGLDLTTSALTISGSPVMTFVATTGIVDGMVASGTGIPLGTTVLSHTGTTITLTANTTGVASGAILSFTSMTIGFANNQLVTGSLSGATGIARRVLNNAINVGDITGTFEIGDVLTGPTVLDGPSPLIPTAKVQSIPDDQLLVTQYQHEVGYDKVTSRIVEPITSGFTSRNIGFAVGTPIEDAPKTIDVLTRVQRFEPDFNQVGDLIIEVLGRSFAQDEPEVLNTYVMAPGESFQDFVDQARIVSVRITSNTLGGFYEQGQVLVKLEPGDERSTKNY